MEDLLCAYAPSNGLSGITYLCTAAFSPPGPLVSPPTDPFAPHTPLNLLPQHVRNEKTRQLSPFELDVVGPLLRNVGDKIKHKVSCCSISSLSSLIFVVPCLYTPTRSGSLFGTTLSCLSDNVVLTRTNLYLYLPPTLPINRSRITFLTWHLGLCSLASCCTLPWT